MQQTNSRAAPPDAVEPMVTHRGKSGFGGQHFSSMRQLGGQEQAGIWDSAGQGTGIAPVVTKLVAHVAVETLPISPTGPTDQSIPQVWKGSHPHGHILRAPQPKSSCPGSLDWNTLPFCSLEQSPAVLDIPVEL